MQNSISRLRAPARRARARGVLDNNARAPSTGIIQLAAKFSTPRISRCTVTGVSADAVDGRWLPPTADDVAAAAAAVAAAAGDATQHIRAARKGRFPRDNSARGYNRYHADSSSSIYFRLNGGER